MKKVIRDGKVAVLYSPGYGAGWSTWIGNEAVIFDPEVVTLVEAGRRDEVGELFERRYGDDKPYCGGADSLRIAWLPIGTKFIIREYDGNESIEIMDEIFWIEA